MSSPTQSEIQHAQAQMAKYGVTITDLAKLSSSDILMLMMWISVQDTWHIIGGKVLTFAQADAMITSLK